MRNWQQALVSPKTTMLEAIEAITKSSMQAALVVDTDKRLLGMVTDGDIRRALLAKMSMTEPVESFMRKNCTVASEQDTSETILQIMNEKQLRHIPVLNEAGKVISVKRLIEMIEPKRLDNWVVLMAGGQGERLRPLTNNCPKPLLNVGGKPVLETIIENFKSCGLRKFYISINYKAAMIEDYFGDGSSLGVEIQYVREEKPLGTVGALRLLPQEEDKPIIIMNGDLLTKIHVEHLLHFHNENGASATMCVREYDFQVPYGVVKVDGHFLQALEEKPVQSFFVNAGIYVLDPEIIQYIPKNTYFDMPSLFNILLERGELVSAFPIHEYWIDIGRIADYERANGDYTHHFDELR